MVTLLEIIREQVKQKGRKVKVISDWDDVVQSQKPFSFYLIENPKHIPYKDWFVTFWEKVRFEKLPGSANKRAMKSSFVFNALGPEDYIRLGLDKEKYEKLVKDRNDFRLRKLFMRKEKDFYEKSPYLSLAEDILKALEEDLISEAIFVSASRKGVYPGGGDPRKREKFAKSYGKFPQCELDLIMLEEDHDTKGSKPLRWDWVKDKHPDFDIFIDDNQGTTYEVRKLFPDLSHCLVMPDYKTNVDVTALEGGGIFLAKTEVSDITDNDFEKAAERYKQKQKQKQQDQEIAALELKVKDLQSQLQEAKTQKPNLWTQPSTYLLFASGIGIALLGFAIYRFLKNKKP